MKKLLFILLIIISSCKSGYIVTIETQDDFHYEVTDNKQEINKLLTEYIPGINWNVDSLMKKSPYFRIETYNVDFYCELKKD